MRGLTARGGIPLNVAQEAIQMQTVVSLLGRRGVVYRELAG